MKVLKEISLLQTVISLASIILIIGILFPFWNFRILDSEYDSPEYVTAIFSLSGILFFCAALIYQIREYKLQVDELKKSVEAQTKSSAALEEQKILLLEQNTNSLIFKMIDGFNQFKKDELIQDAIIGCYARSHQVFSSYFANMVTHNVPKDRFNKELAQAIKENFTEIIKRDVNSRFIKKFVQFAYNIFYIIDQKKIPNQKDWFTPYIYIHLSKEESLILHLSNLVDQGMPISDKVQWHNSLTLDLIEMINPIKERAQYNLLDTNTLTEELNEIKQKY